MRMKFLTIAALPLLASTLLTGCANDDDAVMVSYQVTVTNLTEAQPLSPPAVILHRDGYHAWQVGMSAGDGLEQLAEGGATDALLTEAALNSAVKSTAADSAVILPGSSSSVIIEGEKAGDLQLTLATMLVNSNDAFTGLEAEPIHALALQESETFEVAAYDAGTEANSESAATVPGPAAGGEGYNSARDDRDSVGGHPGVVTADDGLSGSALDVSHRFDNPVARITITRLE